MDHQTDEAWVLGVQRKLYQWSKANPEDAWRDMWGWVTDLRVLRHAWQRVASNRGRRTAGIDGMTMGRLRNGIGEQRFLEGLQAELRSGAYRPSPARRKLIPKAGKPGQFRPLAFPRSRIASSKARSRHFWSQSSRRSSGMSPMGSGPDGARTAPWSISDGLPSRINATGIPGGVGCRIHGSSRATLRAASII